MGGNVTYQFLNERPFITYGNAASEPLKTHRSSNSYVHIKACM